MKDLATAPRDATRLDAVRDEPARDRLIPSIDGVNVAYHDQFARLNEAAIERAKAAAARTLNGEGDLVIDPYDLDHAQELNRRRVDSATVTQTCRDAIDRLDKVYRATGLHADYYLGIISGWWNELKNDPRNWRYNLRMLQYDPQKRTRVGLIEHVRVLHIPAYQSTWSADYSRFGPAYRNAISSIAEFARDMDRMCGLWINPTEFESVDAFATHLAHIQSCGCFPVIWMRRGELLGADYKQVIEEAAGG